MMNTIKQQAAEEYHGDTSAWSRSMLSVFRESKREAYLRYVAKEAPPEETRPCMKLGSLAHTMLLEPAKLEKQFCIIPQDILAKNGAISTKEAKAFVEEKNSQGVEVVKQAEWDNSKRVVDSVLKVCGKWLEKATHIEHSIYWKDEVTGLPLKARPDFIIHGGDDVFVFDLKTTTRIIPHTFIKSIENYEYYLQDVHYRQGVAAVTGRMPHMIFVGIEQGWPYRAALFQLTQETRNKSFECWRYLVNDLKTAFETNDFSDPWEKEINPVTLKDYVFGGSRP